MTLYIDTKPTLEWVEYQGRYITNGYEVRFDPIEGKWCWWYYDETEDQPYYEDPYRAKAAAQADYDRRTAERFKAVELPVDIPVNFGKGSSFAEGYRTAVMHLKENIYIAKEQP
jgi:hypothetical protein